MKRFALALVLILGSITAAVQPSQAHDDGPGERGHAAKYLYIWAGDQARIAPDFVTVIDFDEHSKDYGKILKVAPVPTSGNSTRVPSGFTPRSGTRPPTTGPPYTIRAPSGDHIACRAALCTTAPQRA